MLVYIAAPVSPKDGETIQSNLHRAKRWLRHMMLSYPNITPVAPWITTCEVLDDTNPEDRARGIQMNETMISRCESVWMVGPRVSAGMLAEAELARRFGIPVFSYLHHGAEPPESPCRLDGRAYQP